MNRKIALPLAAAGLILATFAPVPAAPTAVAKEKGGIYLALGDSLAEGYGATDPQTTAYVPHLFKYFHGAAHGGVDVLNNMGLGGETSTSFIAGGQLDGALAAIADPTTHVAVVTFDIGGNDFLNLLQPPSPCAINPRSDECMVAAAAMIQTFGANYVYSVGALTTALAQEGPGTPLLVMTYYNPWSGTGDAKEPVVDLVLLGQDGAVSCAAIPGHPENVGVNDIISCYGAQMGAVVANVYPRFEGKGAVLTHIAEGDIHPNNAGYAQIAATFEAAYRTR